MWADSVRIITRHTFNSLFNRSEEIHGGEERITRSSRKAAPRAAPTGNAAATAECSIHRNIKENDAGQSWPGGSSRNDAKAGTLAQNASTQGPI
jgi:hypothetical protein